MKVVPFGAAAAVCGLGLGVALAYYEVGETETAFAPSAASIATLGAEGPLGADPHDHGPSTAAPNGPVAKVDAPVHDFGTMQRGTSRTHDFVFTNTGTKPLTLEVGSSTCKCTVGEVADRPLAPGQSAPVKLEWIAKTAPGSFRQSATIITNDPRQSRVDLTIEGVVTEPAGLEPQEFLFGKMAAEETRTASVYLAAYEEDPPEMEVKAWIDENSALSDRVKVEVERVPLDEVPIERATTAVKITVEAGPGLPVGQLTEWIKVRTNLESVGQNEDGVSLQIPFYASVEGDVSVHGSLWSDQLGLLNLGKVASRKGKETKLILSFKGEHASEGRAEVASVDPPWLEVDFDEPQAAGAKVRQFMTVRVPPGRPSVIRSGLGEENGGVGDGDGRIRLKLNHPTMTELDIKVRFLVAE